MLSFTSNHHWKHQWVSQSVHFICFWGFSHSKSPFSSYFSQYQRSDFFHFFFFLSRAPAWKPLMKIFSDADFNFQIYTISSQNFNSPSYRSACSASLALYTLFSRSDIFVLTWIKFSFHTRLKKYACSRTNFQLDWLGSFIKVPLVRRDSWIVSKTLLTVRGLWIFLNFKKMQKNCSVKSHSSFIFISLYLNAKHYIYNGKNLSHDKIYVSFCKRSFSSN